MPCAVSHLSPPRPLSCRPRVSSWWDLRCDVGLVYGCWKHGYANYDDMRRDPEYQHLFGPSQTALAPTSAAAAASNGGGGVLGESVAGVDQGRGSAVSSAAVVAGQATGEGGSGDAAPAGQLAVTQQQQGVDAAGGGEGVVGAPCPPSAAVAPSAASTGGQTSGSVSARNDQCLPPQPATKVGAGWDHSGLAAGRRWC
jgi:hypothetical protein